MATVITYQEAIEQLKQKAADHGNLGEERAQRRLEQTAQTLASWVMNGQSGPCPVDLAQHGIFLTEPQLPKAEPQPFPPPIQATPLVDDSKQDGIVLDEEQPLVSKPPDSSTTPNPLPDEDEATSQLAQSNLNRAFAEAQDFWNKGNFRAAKATAETILRQPISNKSFEEAVRDLLDKATTRFNQQLEGFLDNGDEARKSGQLDEAKKQYNLALELAPDNSQALRALLEIDNVLIGSLSRDKYLSLRSGLREERDIDRLGRAVREAEALEAEDKLPPDLLSNLPEARQRFNDIRRKMGEETTMMRFGDLAGRAAAVENFRKRVERGEPTIFDVTVNQNRPAVEVLNNAITLHDQGSEDTAQYELDLVKKRLPSAPKWARERLEKALQEPFSDKHRRGLQGKLTEVQDLVDAQDEAERLLAKAETLTEPLEIFKLFAQAYSVFRHLQGLEERLQQIRQMTLGTLSAQMRQHYQDAEAALATNNYSLARQEVGKGNMIPARWPQDPKPEELENLLADGQNLQNRINIQAEEEHKASERQKQIERDFAQLAETIRKRVPNPNLRQSGLALYQQAVNNPDYQNLPELKILSSELDQYKGISEQLTEAREAKARNDWERVRDLAGKMQRSGKVGQFADEINQMVDLAGRKLNLRELDTKITTAETHLANDEISQAKESIRNVSIPEPIDQDDEEDKNHKNNLKQRYQTILTSIQECEGATKAGPFSLEDLFKYAKTLSEKRGLRERSKALRIYRYVGGDTEQRSLGKTTETLGADIPQKLRDGWPPYKRSLYTAEARREARKMAQSLRQDFFAPLQELYNRRNDLELDEDELQPKAEQAGLLREDYLLESEEERVIVRWVEVRYGEKNARTQEEAGNWEEAVRIWDVLKQNYPRWPTIEAGWRSAKIQKALRDAKLLLQAQGNSQEAIEKRTQALQSLQETQTNLGGAQSWEIELAMADAYITLGQFDKAIEATNRAKQSQAGEALATEKEMYVIREKEIRAVLAEVSSPLDENQADMAGKFLRKLQTAIRQEPTKDSKRLVAKRDRIFNETKEFLLQEANNHQRQGSNETKIQAVVKLVQLRELEEVVAWPEDDRASLRELENLRLDLINVIKNITREARNFSIQNKSLQQVSAETTSLGGRLQTFIRDIPLTDQELGTEKENLRLANEKIIDLQGQLKRLKDLLDMANQSKWETALLEDNFSELESLNSQITSIGVSELTDVQNFGQKLTEWKEIHQYFLGQIMEIKGKFSKQEDFEGVVHQLRLLLARPDTRSKGSVWQQLKPTDYRAIYNLMNSRLRVMDIFAGGEIVGWADLEQEAIQLQENFGLWEKWHQDINRLMSHGQNLVNKTQTHYSGTLVIDQINDWTSLSEITTKTLTLIDAPPEGSYRSYKAKSYSDRANEARAIAEQWKNSADIKLSSLQGMSQFPSAQDFNSAANDCGRLKFLLDQADRIGTNNLNDKRRVEQYRKIYHNNCGPNKTNRSIWDRIFKRE